MKVQVKSRRSRSLVEFCQKLSPTIPEGKSSVGQDFGPCKLSNVTNSEVPIRRENGTSKEAKKVEKKKQPAKELSTVQKTYAISEVSIN